MARRVHWRGMFAKHSTLFVACLLLFEATVLVVSKSDLCETLKPCGKRGECVLTGDAKSKDIFATKCFCLLNYSGTWCQFVGKNIITIMWIILCKWKIFRFSISFSSKARLSNLTLIIIRIKNVFSYARLFSFFLVFLGGKFKAAENKSKNIFKLVTGLRGNFMSQNL